jgi:predicted Rossmann-fold nucleotide-binding protein
MRKNASSHASQCACRFPGGFGIMDEFFDILTLQQTKKAPPILIVLFGRDHC